MEKEAKIIAIASYIHIAGWIVAFIDKKICGTKSELAIFHMRQGLGVTALFLLLHLLTSSIIKSWTATQIVTIIWVAYAAYGVHSAYSEKLRYAPFFGKLFDKYFVFI